MDFIPKKHEGGGGLKKRNQKAIEQKSWKKMERRGYVTLQSFHSNWEVQLKPCTPFFSFGDRQVTREDYVLGKDKR